MTTAELTTATAALFLMRKHIATPEAAVVIRMGLPFLCRSSNAAVATEARRLVAVLERRRLGCLEDSA